MFGAVGHGSLNSWKKDQFQPLDKFIQPITWSEDRVRASFILMQPLRMHSSFADKTRKCKMSGCRC